MKDCRECGKPVSDAAKVCPHCGISAPVNKPISGIRVLVVVGVIAFLASLLSPSSKDASPKQSEDATTNHEDAIAIPPTALVDRASPVAQPPSLVAQSESSEDIDKKAQAEMVSLLNEQLKANPGLRHKPYNPDPQISKKASSLEKEFRIWKVYSAASNCNLSGFSAEKAEKLFDTFMTLLRKEFPDGRDQTIAFNHINRDISKEFQDVDGADNPTETCKRLSNNKNFLKLARPH